MIMKPTRLLLLLATAGLTAASAQTVFEDTTDFANWYMGGSEDEGLLTRGSDLQFDVDFLLEPNTREVIGRAFTPTTINVGETLRFQFDWTQSGASAGILRAGLINAESPPASNGLSTNLGDVDGYSAFLRDNSSLANAARWDTGTSGMPLIGGDNIGSSVDQFDQVDAGTVTYTVVFDVTRSSASQTDVLFSLMNGASIVQSVSGSTTDAGEQQATFNSAFFRISGGVGTFDNMSVSVIPEPGTYALFGGLLALASVMVKRTRRKS